MASLNAFVRDNIVHKLGMYNQFLLMKEFIHLKRRLRFYQRFIKPGSMVFDIGANIGNRTSIFSRLGANVVAVEPQAKVFSYLKRRFKNDPRVILVQAALGDSETWTEIRVSRSHVFSSISHEWIDIVKNGRLRDVRYAGSEKVRMTTLDKLIDTYGVPSFCKIDVEGYELNVIKGLHTQIESLSFEFTREMKQNTIRAIEYLDLLSKYRYNISFADSMRFEL